MSFNATTQQPFPTVPPPKGMNIEAILKQNKVSGSYPIDTWIHLFQYLGYEQQSRAEARKNTSTILSIALGGAFILFIILGIVGSDISPVFFVIVFVLAIVTFIALFSVLTNFPAVNPRMASWDHRIRIILPTLYALRADLHPRKPLSLQVSLQPWKQPAKRSGKRNHKDARKTIDTHYADIWLTGEARLADRSRLRWRYISRWRERQTTFRRSSGKTKTRTKTMHKLVCKLQVRLRQRRYPNLHPVPPLQDGSELEQYSRSDHTIVRVKQKQRIEPEVVQARPLIAAIATAYSQVAVPPRSAARSVPAPQAEPPFLITAPDLQQGLLQAQARGAGVGAYISRHNDQLYLSLDFIRDAQERRHVQHLLQRYQAGETLDTETLTWLGKRLLG